MRKGEIRKSGLPVIDVNTPIETSGRGSQGVSVFVQDQTTPSLSVPFLNERVSTSLGSDTAVGDRVVNLAAGHGAVVGDVLELSVINGPDFIQSKILSINVNAVTIDQPVNRIYTVAGTLVTSSVDELISDGSVTPQVYAVIPLPGQTIDVVRMVINITGTSAMDFETFGSDPTLINGCVIRVKHQDGTFTNLFNFKSNGGYINQAFDKDFLINNGNNVRAFTSRLTWGGASKHGVVIRLDGNLGEELQVVIQDDLTAGVNTLFRLQAQGHAVQS